MEQVICITRSELRQTIEDYIAASRVGDTLSYVETAKLSAAEAAESSTERIWQALCDASSERPSQPPIDQVLFALERQIQSLKARANELAAQKDYSAEFLVADAEAFERARCIVVESCGQVTLGEIDLAALQPGPIIESPPEQFTCAEDLVAGQVVIVNSRGLIEGLRDQQDKTVMTDRPVVSYDFGFFQAEQLLGMFCKNTDAKVRVDFMPDGKVTAWDHSPDVAPIELTDTVCDEPEDNDALFG